MVRALSGARASGIELLVGHARGEFRYFSVVSGRYGAFTKEDADAALELLAPQPDGARAYRAAFPQEGPEELVETVHSDALFRMPSQKLAEANAAAGGTSYLFRHHRRRGLVRSPAWGASHLCRGHRVGDTVLPGRSIPPDPGRPLPRPCRPVGRAHPSSG